MRHPLAGPVNVSLAEFVRGLGPTEEATVRAALNDGMSCARYGQVVVTFGHRRAVLLSFRTSWTPYLSNF